jgi:hypothetical protein
MATFDLSTTFDASNLPALKKQAYDQLIAVPAFKKGYAESSQQKDFSAQGFPDKMRACFKGVADNLNGVVSTRVPGGATTQLIEARHDLKGYFIKAKSCNWGPMSGFLCRHPAFNKNGAFGIESNLTSHYDYKKKYLVAKFGMNDTDTDFVNRAFVPLKITAARKKTAFLKKPLLANAIGADTVYGLDTNAAPDKATGVRDHSKATVVMEFLMKQDKTTQLWSLYYGKVYTRIPDDAKPPNYTEKEYLPTDYANAGLKKDKTTGAVIKPAVGLDFSRLVAEPTADSTIQLDTGALAQLSQKLSSEFQITRPAGFNEWRTIDGIMNPNPPYPASTADHYKNAVSGDYDLFAVWPDIPAGGFQELVRISEEGLVNDPRIARNEEYINYEKLPLNKRYYLLPVAGKKFSLEIRASRNVYMEFIPGFESIGNLESSIKGNVNEAVTLAVGSLNTFVDTKYPKTNGLVAFHSDEGGRPGVNDIEYPVAFFLPKAFADWCGLNTALLIQSHAQFLALINFLKGWYYIPLNWGWFIHLFMMAHTAAELQAAITPLTAENQKNAKKYLEDRLKELNEKLPQGDQAKIIQSLKDLLVPMSQRSTVTTNPETGKKLSTRKIKANTAKKDTDDAKQSQDNELIFNTLKAKFLALAKGDIPSGNKVPPYMYWKKQFETLMQEKTAPKNP